jgi:hypothetical protein
MRSTIASNEARSRKVHRSSMPFSGEVEDVAVVEVANVNRDDCLIKDPHGK